MDLNEYISIQDVLIVLIFYDLLNRWLSEESRRRVRGRGKCKHFFQDKKCCVVQEAKYSILHLIRSIISFSALLESRNVLSGRVPRHILEKSIQNAQFGDIVLKFERGSVQCCWSIVFLSAPGTATICIHSKTENHISQKKKSLHNILLPLSIMCRAILTLGDQTPKGYFSEETRIMPVVKTVQEQ